MQPQVKQLTFEDLNAQIYACQKCRLWKGAKHAVPGEGPTDAKLVLVGQNPGREEDETGRPFVGRSGKFLNKILEENNLKREEIFITSIVKHISPNNRKPLPDEIEACKPYLEVQLKTIKPETVVLMGKAADEAPRIESIRYVETVHPSAAMRFTKMRKRFLEDFKHI